MPRLVAAPRPGAGAEAGAVRHQVADRHLRDVAERVVDLPQLGHVLDRRIVERQQAAIAQLHDRDAGERLGDRRPVKDRLLVNGPLRRRVLEALERLVDDRAVPDEHQAAADDARFSHTLMIERCDSGPMVARRCGLKSERAGDGACDRQTEHGGNATAQRQVGRVGAGGAGRECLCALPACLTRPTLPHLPYLPDPPYLPLLHRDRHQRRSGQLRYLVHRAVDERVESRESCAAGV